VGQRQVRQQGGGAGTARAAAPSSSGGVVGAAVRWLREEYFRGCPDS